jgi:MSHA biogenesis protein MshJ
MKLHWDKMRNLFEQGSERERWMVLLACLGVIYAIFDLAWLAPQFEGRRQAEQRLEDAQSELERTKTRAQEVAALWEVDPDRVSRRRQVELKRQIAELELRLDGLTQGLIPPEHMVAVLEGILARGENLQLIRLESLPAVPLFRSSSVNPGAEEGGDQSGAQLYRHGFVLELQGGYAETLRYLRAIEEQSWQLFWDGIRFEVIDYPKANVEIKLHTLSQREGWIGV